MKTRILLVASLSTLALAVAVLGQETSKVTAKPAPRVTSVAPVAAPQPVKADDKKESAPTKAEEKKEAAPIKVAEPFQASYEELNALLRVIDSLEKDAGLPALRLKANSIAAILRAQIPEGYQFDPIKKEFVPLPKPAEKVADKK